MENLLRILLKPCTARIEIGHWQTAINTAKSEYSTGDQSKKLIIWTDGSQRESRSGFAVVWRDPSENNEWDSRVFRLDAKFNNNIAELFAVLEGVKFAFRRCQEDTSISKVIFYTDSQFVLELLQSYHVRPIAQRGGLSRQLELAEIKKCVEEIDIFGNEVVFRWVPGHSKVPGNVRADHLASQASKTGHAHETYEPPQNGYLESSPMPQMKPKNLLQSVRHGRIEKTASAQKHIPTKRFQIARVQQVLQDTETGVAETTILDKLEAYVDKQIAENRLSLSGSQA